MVITAQYFKTTATTVELGEEIETLKATTTGRTGEANTKEISSITDTIETIDVKAPQASLIVVEVKEATQTAVILKKATLTKATLTTHTSLSLVET